MWSSFLPWAEYWYNTTFHSSTDTTPSEAVYGRPPPLMSRYDIGSTLIGEIDEQMRNKDELLDELEHHLAAANNRMKQLADKKRCDVEFEAGDWVFLKLQPYRQKSVINRSSHKLSNRFYGPFRVEVHIRQVAYHLKLPEGSRIHLVFHVSLLKKRVGDDVDVAVELPPLREDGLLSLAPDRVIRSRLIHHGPKEITEVLVQWSNLPPEETWENLEQLSLSFTKFQMNLEDKVLLDGRSIVRIQDEEEIVNDAEVARRISAWPRKHSPRYLN